MNPWEIWLWPWIVASALTQRALETVHGSMEANDGDATLPRVNEPEWASPNHVTIELDAMRVRDFSVVRGKQRSTLIVAPFALHVNSTTGAGGKPTGVREWRSAQ
jgi:hypothetical protein